MKYLSAIAAIVVASAVSGCIGEKMAVPQPSMATLQLLRDGNLPGMAVGPFALAPGKPESMDKSVTIRSVVLEPQGDSLARYLGETLEADLRAAGKLDASSPLSVQGLLTDSQVDSGIGTGHAALGATFILSKSGKTIFSKDFSVNSSWDSSFVGAVAIPDAMNNYTALYNELAAKLFADSEFIAAAKASK